MFTYSNWLQPALQNLLQHVVRFFHPRSSCTTHISADVQRITLNTSCMTISGGRTKNSIYSAASLALRVIFQFHSCGTYLVLSRSPSLVEGIGLERSCQCIRSSFTVSHYLYISAAVTQHLFSSLVNMCSTVIPITIQLSAAAAATFGFWSTDLFSTEHSRLGQVTSYKGLPQRTRFFLELITET